MQHSFEILIAAAIAIGYVMLSCGVKKICRKAIRYLNNAYE